MKIQAKHNYYVYILTNKAKTVLYVGVTNDLKQRLYFHNHPEPFSKAIAAKYKVRYLVYYEHFTNIEAAINREKQIKKFRREKKVTLINKFNPTWRFLNDEV